MKSTTSSAPSGSDGGITAQMHHANLSSIHLTSSRTFSMASSRVNQDDGRGRIGASSGATVMVSRAIGLRYRYCSLLRLHPPPPYSLSLLLEGKGGEREKIAQIYGSVHSCREITQRQECGERMGGFWQPPT
jgi:hypothetical protein